MATQDRLHVQHYYTTGTSAPSPSNLELGEIAVGTNPNKPCVYFRDTNNNVHTLTEGKNYLDKTITGTTQEVNGNVKFNSGIDTVNIINDYSIEIAGGPDDGKGILRMDWDGVELDYADADSYAIDSGIRLNRDLLTLQIGGNDIYQNINLARTQADDASFNIELNGERQSGSLRFYINQGSDGVLEVNDTPVSLEGHTHNEFLVKNSASPQIVTSEVEFYHNITADTIIANYVDENPLILQYTDDDMLDGNSIISLSSNSMDCTVKTSSNETNLSISDSSLTYTMNVDAGGRGTITFGVDELDGAYIEVDDNKVSIEGHKHAASSITSGQFTIARIPTGTTSTTVARGDHSHSANSITSGQFNIARIPTGITSTTVARGNHGHSNYLTLNGGTLTGALTAPAFYETSDERLKTFEEDIDVDFEKLSKLRKSVYFLNDDDLAIRHIGMSAQEVYEVYPQLIDVRKDTTEQYMSLDYSKLSVVALKAIDKLYETNQKLEERVKMLEEKLMSLGNN